MVIQVYIIFCDYNLVSLNVIAMIHCQQAWTLFLQGWQSLNCSHKKIL